MLNCLSDLIIHLDKNLDVEVRGQILHLPENRLIDMHFGLNALIRSLVFYRNDSELGKSYFSRLGTADEASGVLGEIYWRHVHRIPVNENFVADAIERHWIFLTDSERELLAHELAENYGAVNG